MIQILMDTAVFQLEDFDNNYILYVHWHWI